MPGQFLLSELHPVRQFPKPIMFYSYAYTSVS